MTLDPRRAVADFDSATMLHAQVQAALRGDDFARLGNPLPFAAVVRAAGRLPGRAVRRLYRAIGASEALDPEVLGEVDLGAVAALLADIPGEEPLPAVVVGSSNGAVAHLAAAMRAAWLPGTVLVPVARRGDPARPDLALEFGRRAAPPLLAANPDVVLHQMHDPAQDELMSARLAYFRVKFSRLPEAYLAALESRLAPGGAVVLVDDRSTWPVTRVGERHLFQSGGRGGLSPAEHLAHPAAPPADETAAEAEWGSEPAFSDAVRDWARRAGHPLVEISIDDPQAAADPAARLLRDWTRERGGAGDRLLVPSFALADPVATFRAGLVPFWTYFAVRDALDALDAHLASSPPYAELLVGLFQHGVASPGVIRPTDVDDVAARHGVPARTLGLRRRGWPRDIGALDRFGSRLRREPDAGLPSSPLDPARVAAVFGGDPAPHSGG